MQYSLMPMAFDHLPGLRSAGRRRSRSSLRSESVRRP